MSDTFALRHVLDGYRADIARRTEMIRTHRECAAALAADNYTDAVHAEVAEALLAALAADPAPAWAPTTEVQAAALVADNVLIGGLPGSGKSALRLLALAALMDAEADIAAVDGAPAAAFIHDHAAEDCPACLLTGAGDLSALDGIATGSGVAR
jgi:hypothetical protein